MSSNGVFRTRATTHHDCSCSGILHAGFVATRSGTPGRGGHGVARPRPLSGFPEMRTCLAPVRGDNGSRPMRSHPSSTGRAFSGAKALDSHELLCVAFVGSARLAEHSGAPDLLRLGRRIRRFSATHSALRWGTEKSIRPHACRCDSKSEVNHRLMRDAA